MTLDEDLRRLADDRLQELNLREERHRRARLLWETAKQQAIRPACETVTDVAEDYKYFTASFDCENGACLLRLDSSKATPSFVTLRFELDLAKSRIETSSELSGKEHYSLEPLDVDAIEGRVRNFFDAFLGSMSAAG